MDNSLLAVRDINHKYIVVDESTWANLCLPIFYKYDKIKETGISERKEVSYG